MKRLSQFAILTAALFGQASANIPFGPIPQVGWRGPGLLCEVRFSLAVLASERVREDIQLEPWYPSSDTVKSPDGWYSISVPSALSLKRDWPARSQRKTFVQKYAEGSLYRVALINSEKDQASFVFFPIDRKIAPVEIVFWKPFPKSTDWMSEPPPAVRSEKGYLAVFKRINFAGRTAASMPANMVCFGPATSAALSKM